MADILMGHELARPAKNLPPALLVRTGEALARKIVPGVELSCYSDQPYLLSVMASRASKTVRADHPGNQPDIRCHDIQEDCTLFGGAFSEGNVSTYRRAKIFAYPNMGHEYIFNTKTGEIPTLPASRHGMQLFHSYNVVPGVALFSLHI